MSNWTQHNPYNNDKVVIGSKNFNSTTGVDIDSDNVGLNSTGKKVVSAGLFLANVGGVNRFLPRDLAQADITTGSTAVEVSMPELFLVGDMIYQLEPEGLITLADTWAADDTVTIRFIEPSKGINVQYTHTQVGANLAALDDELVAALNLATNPLSKYARFEVGTAGQIKIFTKGLVPTVSVVATTDGDGAATVTTQPSAIPVLIGTVASIDHVNSTLTLGANAAKAISEGARIGVLASDIYGIHAHSVDFSDVTARQLNAVDVCDRVYISGLAYYDQELDARFPNLIFK
jgi:hypothetical protein